MTNPLEFHWAALRERRFRWMLAALVLFAGCGGEREYHLSGTVTYKGQPIPEGYIVFEPDGSQGNTGAPGRCKILDGKYDTRADKGRGTVGGLHKIRIVGMDGKIGGDQDGGAVEISLPKPLFPPYTFDEELPTKDSTMDFEVPSS